MTDNRNKQVCVALNEDLISILDEIKETEAYRARAPVMREVLRYYYTHNYKQKNE